MIVCDAYDAGCRVFHNLCRYNEEFIIIMVCFHASGMKYTLYQIRRLSSLRFGSSESWSTDKLKSLWGFSRRKTKSYWICIFEIFDKRFYRTNPKQTIPYRILTMRFLHGILIVPDRVYEPQVLEFTINNLQLRVYSWVDASYVCVGSCYDFMEQLKFGAVIHVYIIIKMMCAARSVVE